MQPSNALPAASCIIGNYNNDQGQYSNVETGRNVADVAKILTLGCLMERKGLFTNVQILIFSFVLGATVHF